MRLNTNISKIPTSYYYNILLYIKLKMVNFISKIVNNVIDCHMWLTVYINIVKFFSQVVNNRQT